MAFLAASILPFWLVIPVAAAAMFATALHIVTLQKADISPLRLRLRTGAGLTMMLVTALFAWGIGISPGGIPGEATPAQSRVFVLVWISIIALVGFAVLLAILDAFLTFRDAAAERARMRKAMSLKLRDDSAAFRARAGSEPAQSGSAAAATPPRSYE